MNLFRALSYKEWMKTRRLIGVMLLLMAVAVGYTYIDLTHEIRLNEAVNVWYGCLFQGTSVAPWMMYLLPLAGIALGVVQYVPEMTQKRLKLTLHLPAADKLWPPCCGMVSVSSCCFVCCFRWSWRLWFVCFCLPRL